jgi:hypothetical protein
MSLSLSQLLSRAKTRPLILLAVALLVVAVIGYLLFSKPSKERLIQNLNAELRAEKFEQLYEEADDSVHLNVDKEKFVKRMKMALTKLKAIDENLAFQRDGATETLIRDAREGPSGKIIYGDESLVLTAFQKLEKEGKSAIVCFNWSSKGKFMDLWVLPTQGTSEEYRVLGVSAKHYSVGNQVLDW